MATLFVGQLATMDLSCIEIEYIFTTPFKHLQQTGCVFSSESAKDL